MGHWHRSYRGGRSHFIDVVASVGGHDGLLVLTLVSRQVVHSHDAAPLLNGRHNGLCYSALVEACAQRHCNDQTPKSWEDMIFRHPDSGSACSPGTVLAGSHDMQLCFAG